MHYQTRISRWIKFRLPLKNISASWRWVQTISEDSINLTAPETTWKKWMSISYNIVKEEFFVIMTTGLFAFNRQILGKPFAYYCILWVSTSQNNTCSVKADNVKVWKTTSRFDSRGCGNFCAEAFSDYVKKQPQQYQSLTHI